MRTDSFSCSVGSVHVPWDSKYVVRHVSSVNYDGVSTAALGWSSGGLKSLQESFLTFAGWKKATN